MFESSCLPSPAPVCGASTRRWKMILWWWSVSVEANLSLIYWTLKVLYVNVKWTFKTSQQLPEYIITVAVCYVFIVSREIQKTLGFKNHKTCMREAALLDYYVCGFWWAKEASFSPTQTSFTMAVLHSLLDNIRGREVTCQGVVFFIFYFFAVVSSCVQHQFLSLT